MTDAHRAIAARIVGMAGDAPRRILELGAGNGGVAAALCDLGHAVTALDFNEHDVELARELGREREGMTVVHGDFYAVTFEQRFDVVFYWDGFGVGGDEDQRRLLKRIADDWLTSDGIAILDVYSPWAWQRRHGETSVYTATDGTSWERRIEFDADASRFIDHWEPLPDRAEHRSQTLRCYTPREFHRLVAGTGLATPQLLGMDGRILTDGDPYLRESNGFVALLTPTKLT